MIRIFSKRGLLTLLGLAAAISAAYIILPVSIPIITAFITALLLEPLVKFFQRKFNLARRISVLVVFIIFIIFIGLSSYFITTKVITEAINIIERIPLYINEITNAWLKAEAALINAAKDLPREVVNQFSMQVSQFLNNLKNDLLAYVNINNVKLFLTKIPNYLVSFIVYLIALFLLMLDLPRLREKLNSHLTEKTAAKVNFMTSRLSYVIFGFLKAQFLISAIIFFVSLIGLILITPEIAIVMSLIIWLIDFIPIIGSIVIFGPWALFHLLTGNMAMGTQLAILGFILLIIRRTVEPKVMGSHIGLSPLSTLIAMYFGYKLLGVFGFIIGPLLLIGFNSAKEAGIIKVNFKL